MAKRTIMKNETIPVIGKVLGQTSMTYVTGGNTSTSFNSTDLFNFDVKDEGEIEEKDPQKSYLTTTFYPLLFVEKLNSQVSSVDRIVLTDNLYATHGLADDVSTSLFSANIIVFKKALIELDYYSNSFAKRDAFTVKASLVNVVLRDVLRLNSTKEQFRVGIKDISLSYRNVLINYTSYKPESIGTTFDLVDMVHRLFTTKFTSLLIADSANVGAVVNNDVTMIKDKGQLSWSFSNNMTVDKEARFEENALKMDKDPSYLQSNESLNITSEDGVELFFEDWIKPSTVTKSLLNNYNNNSNTKEIPKLSDKIDSVLWAVTGSGFSLTTGDYALRETNTLKRVATPTDFVLKNPTINTKGTTIDLNCTVVGTDKIYLLSNATTTLSTAVKSTFALVWYGDATADANLKNKIAIVGDDPALIDVNSHMIVSTDNFPTGSTLKISIVFYSMYVKLFVNGVLQGVKYIERDFNLGEGGFLTLGGVSWYTYKATHTYTIQSFRFSTVATHTGNSFVVTDSYDLRAIPNIAKLNDPVKYNAGLTCGVRYKESDNTTRAFLSITDSNDQVFEVESYTLDILKWNYVQMANTKNEVTLFVNGVAAGSMILPYNIKFKDIILGSKESNGYMGKMDNFRIYSKLQDESYPLRSSELFFTQNNVSNTKLSDSNPELVWVANSGAVFNTSTNTTYRSRELVGGLTTSNVKYLLNPYNFHLKTVLKNISYKTNVDTSVISTSTPLANTSKDLTQSVNLLNNSVKVSFNITSLEGATLITIGGLVFRIVQDGTGYKLSLDIGVNSTALEYSFKLATSYVLSMFKVGTFLHVFVGNDLILKTNVQTTITAPTITLGPLTGAVDNLIVGEVLATQNTVISNYSVDLTQGFMANIYEPFKDTFYTDCYFDTITRASGAILTTLGYNTYTFHFKGKELWVETNKINSEKVAQVPYLEGDTKFSILPTNKTPLAYFEAITSSQDALLPVPYTVEAKLNETVYSKSVLALSSDSYYSNNAIFDRSSNGLAKDVINTGVTKGIKHPGFFFDGTGNYLKVVSDDFAFGAEEFYIEFEVYLNSLSSRAVILDRYLGSAGSWQVSINTDGHLYWTITTNGSFYFVDIPAGFTTKEFFKVQISRKGTIFKFYVNEVQVYEYNPNTVITFDKKDVALHIGYQGTVVNSNYNLNGYLNNIRIVKGLSLDVETDEESKIVEKIKENPSHKAVSDAVEELIGAVDWVLDPINNQIRYTKPDNEPCTATSCAPSEYVWKRDSALGTFSSQYGICQAVASAYGQTLISVSQRSDGQWACNTEKPNGATDWWAVDRVANPTYDPNAEEEKKTLPLGIVAQKIISNAELGDMHAVDFVGVRREIAEQYTLYSISSDTLLNVYAKDNAFFDGRGNTWTNTPNASVEVGKAPNYAQWFISGAALSTVPSITFSNTSEMLLESSFTLNSEVATPKDLYIYGNLVKVSVDALNKGIIITFNGTVFKLSHNFKVRTWYKTAICLKDNQLVCYINDFKFVLPYVGSTWSVVNATFTIPQSDIKFEVVKLSSKCPYKINKGKENLNLDTHLLFEKNKVDNGNKPKLITVAGTTTNTLNPPVYGISYESLAPTSLVSLSNSLNSGKTPFSIELNIRLTLEGREDILSFSNSGISCSLYKDIDNKIKFSYTTQEDTTIFESKNVVPLNKWFKLNLSRDLGNILSIGIDEGVDYITGFNYDVTSEDLKIQGFTGDLYEVKIFNRDSIVSRSSLNVLKLDFEDDSLSPNYLTDRYNNKLLNNSNVSLIKGLSKTSDYVGYFDGTSSFLSVQKDAYLNFKQDDFAIELNVYPTNGVNDFQTLFATSSSSVLSDSFFIMMYGSNQPTHIVEPASNRIAVGFGPDLSTNPFLLTNTQLSYNVWTKIKIERKKNTFTVYINDVVDKAVTIVTDFDLNVTGTTFIGKNGWDGSKSFFQGYLDDIRISRFGSYKENTEINTTEGLISGLDFEDVGSGYDVIESSLDGNTVDNYKNTWVLGRYDASSDYPYFRTVSAVNDAIFFKNKGYLSCHNKHFAMGLDPFTLSVDFNQVKRSAQDTYIVHVYGLYSIMITSSGYLEVDFNGITRTRISLINLDTMYTFAITRDISNTVRMFLNGKVIVTVANVLTNFNFGTGVVQPLCLGTRHDTRTSSGYVGTYFSGYIDNFLFDRGVCRYDKEYAVFIDKAEKIKYQSFVEFKENGITSFPDLAVPSLQWTSSGLTTISTGNKYTTFAGRNTANGSYMNSTAHGIQLGYKDFCIDLIFKPQQTTAETCLLDLSLNTGITEGLRILQHNTSTAAITVEVGNTGATEWATSLTTGVNSLANNKVYHLRVVRNLGTIYIYLDGELKVTQDYILDINIGSTFSLFNNRARNRGFTGTIEQFRLIVGSSISALTPFTPLTESFK